MSQSQQPVHTGLGGNQPPRLPSFDAGDDFDWFDSNKVANTAPSFTDSGTNTTSSSRSTSASAVPSINGPLSRSSSRPLDGQLSALHATTPTPPLSSGSSRPPYSGNSQDSSRRSFTASSTVSSSTQDYTSDQYNYPARDSPSSGMSGSSGPTAANQHEGQQYAGGYPHTNELAQYRPADRPRARLPFSTVYPDHLRFSGMNPSGASTTQGYDTRASLDSDHTSYYIPSTSSDARAGYGFPSGPSSSTSHTTYYQPPQSGQHQAGYSGSPYLGSSQSSFAPPNSGMSYNGQYPSASQSGYASTSSGHGSYHQPVRHASRKSAESVRVYPTQPKTSSAYGERAFSFSGMERPALMTDMRPPTNSPRPSSTISELAPIPSPSSGNSAPLYHNPAYPNAPAPYHPHHQHHNSNHSITVPRKAPVVYPALLSRVAEAFKMRITLAERAKDGLSYKDAFDGREAVDKIAYIIRTTDRNLALLLGRALDAQKFFHDVTYDHRLRDSPNELYQFRERLHGASPFGSSSGGDQMNAGLIHHGQHHTGHRPHAGHDAHHRQLMRPPSPTDTMLSEDSAGPVGVFTLLTDCYSPTCTRDRLCYSIACPRRLEQQARLNLKPRPGLKKSNSEEGLLGDDDRLGSVRMRDNHTICGS